jgi:hypothetical protein
MKIKLLAILLVWGVAAGVTAEELFQQCPDVLKFDDYKLLQKYLAQNYIAHELCQRLNNREFLYSDDRNFYYCHESQEADFSCVEHEDHTWFPSPSVAKRFLGENGKKFVLFKTSRLSRGIYSEGYQVFFFTQKSVNPRGYIILSLPEAGAANGLFSDSGKLCSNMQSDSKAVAPIGSGVEIINEGKHNVAIRFNQAITSCDSGQKIEQILEFTWKNGSFERTGNSKIYKVRYGT